MKRMGSVLIGVFLLIGMLAIPARGAPAMELAAKSALLMDAATGTVLYESNAHEPLPPASVTKVMTLLLFL